MREKDEKNSKIELFERQYPFKWKINKKISNLKNKKFPPSESKARRTEELKKTENTTYTVSLPFTSFRCSIIASKIRKILSQYTPYYKLNVVFSTITLEHIISPRLKPEKSYYLNNDLIYDYLCPCEATYIGETQQLLHERILQHRRNKDGDYIYIWKPVRNILKNLKFNIVLNKTTHQSLFNESFSRVISQS